MKDGVGDAGVIGIGRGLAPELCEEQGQSKGEISGRQRWGEMKGRVRETSVRVFVKRLGRIRNARRWLMEGLDGDRVRLANASEIEVGYAPPATCEEYGKSEVEEQ